MSNPQAFQQKAPSPSPSPAEKTDENGLITQARLKELLVYDWRSGELINRTNRSSRARAGDVAGTVNKDSGYRKISLDGKKYLAHRLVFLYVTGSWPKEQLDHIDGDRSNNRFENLHAVSHKENLRNQGIYCSNTSGHVGVHWNKKCNKWQAYIKVNGKMLHLGLFENLEDAIAARKAAEREHGFHPSHGTRPASETEYQREWYRKYRQRQKEAQAQAQA